jgi:hypothetical protein
MNSQRVVAELRGFAAITLVAVAAAGALVYGIDHDPELNPTPPAVSHDGARQPEQFTITEDDPEWNCLIMGDGKCGPEWTPIPESLYDGIGVVSNDETCVWRVRDTTVIVCTDGQVITS